MISIMSKKKKRGRPKCAVHRVVRNFAQLRRTLDLEDVGEMKPCINDLMPVIMERLDEEERQSSLRLAEKWRNRIRMLGDDWFGSMTYDCMGENDLPFDDDYDEYEELYSYTGKKGRKKKKERARKNLYDYYDDEYWENRNTMYRNGEWNDGDEAYEEPFKIIKFYPDIENELSYQEFHSIKEFNDFCDRKGYSVSNIDMNSLINQYLTHCCVDPVTREDVITDTSYGGLYWTIKGDLSKYGEGEDGLIEYNT